MTQNENGFKDLHLRLDNQDIIIRVKPILNHQKNQTGDVHLQVIDSVHNPLSDRDFNDIMFFSRMCLVGIDYLEQMKSGQRKFIKSLEKKQKMRQNLKLLLDITT